MLCLSDSDSRIAHFMGKRGVEGGIWGGGAEGEEEANEQLLKLR